MKKLKERTKEQVPSPRVIDLFCGCGGMSWGAKQAGFNVLAGVDNDWPAIETYRRNFGEDAGYAVDLTEISPKQFAGYANLKPEELELLVGGPPCQGFSKNVPRKYRFLEDPRNQLVSRFLEYVEYLRPQVLIMENVAEMKNGFEGAYTSEVKERLQRAGYIVEVKVMYAPDFGVPQRRRRAFFFANRLKRPVAFPSPTHFETEDGSLFANSLNAYVTVHGAIGDLPSLQHGEGKSPTDYDKPATTWFQRVMREQTKMLYDHVARKLQDTQYQRLASIQAGQGAKHLPDELKPKSHFSGAYGRLEWDALAPTITRWVFHPGSGRFGHPSDVRVITIREAARLQSFSDDFVFAGTYIQKSHQVGNAVPPLLMKAVAEKAKQLLEGREQRSESHRAKAGQGQFRNGSTQSKG
jgi:DNA (cytosine-5)-methyltransferase 1